MELRKLRLSGDNCDQMTMTATGVTESVTAVTVVVTITSRCCNTSHSCRRNHHIAYSPRIRHVFATYSPGCRIAPTAGFTAYSPRRITESARTKRELTARCGTASPGAFPSVLMRTCSPRLHPPPHHLSTCPTCHLPPCCHRVHAAAAIQAAHRRESRPRVASVPTARAVPRHRK